MAAPTLKTERLTLRQIRTSDAASLHVALSDAEAMTWWSSAAHDTLAQTEAYVSRNAEEADNLACWAITESDRDAMGWVILMEKRSGVQELGYILRRDHWGRGFAREAVGRVIAYAFEDLKQRRIFADTDPDNAASITMLERLGFQREGRLRGEWLTHIGVRDSLILGLLRNEWPAGRYGAAEEIGEDV